MIIQTITQSIAFTRCYMSAKMVEVVTRSLHVFSDRSSSAYRSAAYLRSEDSKGRVESQLIMVVFVRYAEK